MRWHNRYVEGMVRTSAREPQVEIREECTELYT
jgi:hypothetical protein